MSRAIFKLNDLSKLQPRANINPPRTLLFAPFIPFIVIFCQVIETKDKSDLGRLHTFVASIKSAHTVSEPAAKMNRLFQALYGIAHRYTNICTSKPQTGQVQDAMMGTYLASMGFMNMEPPHGDQHEQAKGSTQHAGAISGQSSTGYRDILADNSRTGPRALNPVMWLGNGSQLEDWFYHNQAMMEILDSSGELRTEPGSGDKEAQHI